MRKPAEESSRKPAPTIVWERTSNVSADPESMRKPADGVVIPLQPRRQEDSRTLEETVTEWTVVKREDGASVKVTMVSSGFGRVVRTPSSTSPRCRAA
ncbi:hypothetical protein LOK74_23305 [Brevibacillus humidisoli]|uniref:hypothetical protein n=1 Tax=Brevibacillus humidisoli TaxID=2895522 RepID=UPI001E325A0F|nr:hypothetical protein [Brevibacillus humidisoli]UFJ40880.1 hypothetical protein LOK74_23305 [Brevibacillus humidisoli]